MTPTPVLAPPTPTRTIYLVNHNMAGYIPDQDGHYVTTRKDAITSSRATCLSDLAAYRESDKYTTRDSRYSYKMSGRAGDYWLTGHGASIHYWIAPLEALHTIITATDGHHHCANCSMSLDVGEPVLAVIENDDILCKYCEECF